MRSVRASYRTDVFPPARVMTPPGKLATHPAVSAPWAPPDSDSCRFPEKEEGGVSQGQQRRISQKEELTTGSLENDPPGEGKLVR